jgi:hypothetical protein
MRFANYSGEEDISILILNLYEIKERHKPRAKEFAHRLRKANPHIDFDKLAETRPGSLIFLPETPGLKPARHTRPIRHGGLAMLLQMRVVLTSFRAHALASVDINVVEARKTLERIKSREVKARARKDPSYGERLPGIAEAANAKIQNAGPSKIAFQRSFDKLGNDLAQLVNRLSRA